MKRYLPIALFACLLTACQGVPDKLPAEALTRWVEDPDNGCLQTQVRGELEYALLYKPTDYILAQELQKGQLTQANTAERRQSLEDFACFTLRVKSNKGGEVLVARNGDNELYHLRNLYYSYEFGQDIQLITGQDTVPCALYHFVNHYGISPYVDFMLGFDLSAHTQGEALRVEILDRSFNERLLFDYSTRTLLHTPKLEEL